MVLLDRTAGSGDTGTIVGGRYELDGVIGRGGMSVVHAATDTSLNRRVAVKILAPGVDERDAGRLESEVALLASLDHPALVTVFDAVRGDDGRLMIVMQLVDGPDLAQQLLAGPMPPAKVAAFGAGIARALAYLADRDVVHRDVKPANILVLADGSAKLADFGIARIVGQSGPTGTGTIIGTAQYLSPEQVRSEQVGPPSDVYSLGLVLLESLTGVPAFKGSGAELAVARVSADPVIPTALGRDWSALLREMTARDPDARVEAGQAAERLSALAAPKTARYPDAEPSERPTERMAGTGPPSPETRSRFRAVVIALLLALSFALAAGAVAISSQLLAAPADFGARAHAPLTPVEVLDPPDQPADDGGPGNGNGNGNGNGKDKDKDD